MSAPTILGQVQDAAKHRWWIAVLRGVLLIIIGILAIFWPIASLAAFYWVAAIFFIADGLVALVAGIMGRGVPDRGWAIAFGALAIVLGIVALAWPAITVAVLFTLVAVWAIIGGIYAIAAAISARKVPGSGWGWSLTLGILSVLMGIMVIIWPVAGAFTLSIVLTTIVAIYAIIAGIIMIVAGVRIRSFAKAPLA